MNKTAYMWNVKAGILNLFLTEFQYW